MGAVDWSRGDLSHRFEVLQIDPLNPLTTKGTAKILVTLEGNTTGKPDATVSIAVKFA